MTTVFNNKGNFQDVAEVKVLPLMFIPGNCMDHKVLDLPFHSLKICRKKISWFYYNLTLQRQDDNYPAPSDAES